MKIISKSLRELASLCISGQHYQLYLELKATGCNIEFCAPEDEDSRLAVHLAIIEHAGVNWFLYAKAGKIVDSDMDSL